MDDFTKTAIAAGIGLTREQAAGIDHLTDPDMYAEAARRLAAYVAPAADPGQGAVGAAATRGYDYPNGSGSYGDWRGASDEDVRAELTRRGVPRH